MGILELLKFLTENFPALIFIFAGFVFTSIIANRITFHLLKFVELSTANFTASLVQFIILFSSVPFFLWYYSFEQTKIWALVAIVSTAAALALTKKISDLFSGFIIYLMNYYRINDKVTLVGVKGKVIEFNVFNTTLLTREGDIVTIANSDIIEKNVVNHSKSGYQKVTLSVPVYGCEDKDKLIGLMKIAVIRTSILYPDSPIDVSYTIVDGQELYDIVFNIQAKFDIQLCKGIVMLELLKIKGLTESMQNVTTVKILQ